MVRGCSAAWLLVALAAAWPLCARAEDPLRLPELVLRPTPDKLAFPQQADGSFTLPAQQGRVRAIAHLEDEGEPAPIVPAPSSPTHVPEPTDRQPPEMLPSKGMVRPPGEAWQGVAAEPELPPAPAEHNWYHYFARAGSPHCDPNDPERHIGMGAPLLSTSWRNRPLYLNFFAGSLIGDELQEGLVSQGSGFFAGGRFGGDFDHYWGLETRLAFSDVSINYTDGGFGTSRDSFFDASVLYYPWGDSRWRPYLTIGLGVATYRYSSVTGTKISAGAMEMPWGAGMKYLLRPDIALRFDLIDNLSLGGGSRSDPMHNISFTGGIELRFGGRRTSYGSW